ncbi:radical SAM protein [Clostridium paraputrificum]|uniref:SPL family radical SAM protein n=1 Tax=Clostridium paraputrificum TaxID=29363 RepID=UPI003D32FB7F
MYYIDAKQILSGYAENNRWFGLNYNMNLYKGCSHGCIYCDSRSECYGVKNFDSVRAKRNALDILNKELKSKRKKGVIGIGAMSDTYNPFERKLNLTRGALELINRYGFGISIATKSDLILRDIDILKKISNHSPVLIKITITTFHDSLCRKIKPNVVPSSSRFEAIRKLTSEGIFTGILLMPVLPFINDNEENIRSIVRKAKECGAKFIFAYGMGLKLRGNQREYYYEKLSKLFPNEFLVKKYMNIYGEKYECSSLEHRKLWDIFKNECERCGILYKMNDIINAYRKNYEETQISLF